MKDIFFKKGGGVLIHPGLNKNTVKYILFGEFKLIIKFPGRFKKDLY